MTYNNALDYLFDQLPMYQRIGSAAYKTDLDNTYALLKAVGNPHQKLRCIHIGGTNGKGSVSHMLASILQEAGYRVGLYTSPHLIDYRERIQINGAFISEKEVIDFVVRIKEMASKIKPSFFEMTVAMAFYFFTKHQTDIAIIEVGLGGRLDSTNVVHPDLTIITQIGWDHMQFLGNTLPQIAREKAGIIKKDIPLITGETNPKILKLLKELALKKNAAFIESQGINIPNMEFIPDADYQKMNIKTVYAAYQTLKIQGWKLTDTDFNMGVKKVSQNTNLRGRWEKLYDQPRVICDTGHNIDGLKAIGLQLKKMKYQTLHLVIGMVNDKNPEELLNFLPKNARFYFCSPSIPRKLPVKNLAEAAAKLGIFPESIEESVSQAFYEALLQADKDDLIFIGGSTFVVADLLIHLKDTSIEQLIHG